MDSNAALNLNEEQSTQLKPIYPPGKHPNQLAALIPYQAKPGQVLNPNGRPSYAKLLEERLPDSKCAETIERLATQTDNLNVSLAAIKYKDDRVHGPVPQQVNVSKLTMSIDFTEVQHTLEQLQGHNTLDDTQAIDITSTILDKDEQG